MKRLLLIPALVVPAWLYSCTPHTTAPTPAEVIKEAHEALPAAPKAPEPPYVILPSYPNVKLEPAPRKHKAKRKLIHKVPEPVPTPPQRGVTCIFPFNMIPQCTPGSQ